MQDENRVKIETLFKKIRENSKNILTDYSGGRSGFTARTFDWSKLGSIDISHDHEFWKNFSEALSQNTVIDSLILSELEIKDDDLKFICESIKKSKIKCISFDQNKISDAGIQYLINLAKENKEIEFINLAHNKITNDGALKLLIMLNGRNKLSIQLENNHVSLAFILKLQYQFSNRHNLKLDKISKNIKSHKDLIEKYHHGDLIYGLKKPRLEILESIAMSNKFNPDYPCLIVDEIIGNTANEKDIENFYQFASDMGIHIEKDIHMDTSAKLKIGVLWTILNQKKIHFILDDLNMEFSSKNSVHYKYTSSYTSVELRFINRHWNFIKDNVIFWKKDQNSNKLIEVKAPWVDQTQTENFQFWGKYQKSRDQKIPKQRFVKGIENMLVKNENTDVIPVNSESVSEVAKFGFGGKS